MADIGWLSVEAKKIHSIFEMGFYGFVTVFFLLAIILEYFKWPLGNMPSFPVLVSRMFIAVFLLHTYTEVSNLIANFADDFAAQLGTLNNIHLVLTEMGKKCHSLTWSWMSAKSGTILLLSFLGFFLLYISVHIMDALILYTWTILYVFSPLLIALFIFRTTASATGALYRSLIEVSCWKIVWSILATLLWSAALSQITDPKYNISLLSGICFCIVLAGSLLATPQIVHMLAGAGLSKIAGSVGTAAMGAALLGPLGMAKKGMALAKFGGGMAAGGAARAAHGFRHFRRAREYSREKKKLESNLYMGPKSVDAALRRKFKSKWKAK